MKQDRKYRSEILAAVHETAEGLHSIGLIDPMTMREFDEACLTCVEEFGPEDLKSLRKREGASQAVLARHLGVATATVGQWERGERRPLGPAAKLLSLVKTRGLDYIR